MKERNTRARPGQLGQYTRDFVGLRMHQNILKVQSNWGGAAVATANSFSSVATVWGPWQQHVAAAAAITAALLASMPNLFSLNTNIVNTFQGYAQPSDTDL